MNTETPDIGKLAYNAYCEARWWKSFTGQPLPKWEDQNEDLRIAWREVACAVSNEIKKRANEEHVMQLASISTAAFHNVRESDDWRIKRDSPYWTQAYEDVCTAVDREMRERERAEKAEAELDRIQDSTDNEWLNAIGTAWMRLTGNPWETRDGETREEGLSANIGALFQVLEEKQAELDRAEAACAAKDYALRRFCLHASDCVWTLGIGNYCSCGLSHALSSACGTEYIARDKVVPMYAALEQGCKNCLDCGGRGSFVPRFDRMQADCPQPQECPHCKPMRDALAAARELGIGGGK